MRLALVAVAGAAGALVRYGLATAIGLRALPWTIVGINISGSFLLGLIVAAASHRGWSAEVTLPLAVGFLGSFTTFSTFSYDTHVLLQEGRVLAALSYVALSVVGGVLAAAAGYAVATAVL